MQTVAGKYLSVQYIVSYRDIHEYVCHKYSDTLNTLNMLCPLNKAKVISKGSSENQFYFPMLNGALSFLQKYLFLLLSFQFCIIYGTCSQKCTGNFLIISPKSFYYKTHIVFKTISSINVICSYSAYSMFNRYHHAYQINQENVQKSLFKALFIFMKFQTPSPFYPL